MLVCFVLSVSSGINYDKPLPPIQVASLRAERIAKEKKVWMGSILAVPVTAVIKRLAEEVRAKLASGRSLVVQQMF